MLYIYNNYSKLNGGTLKLEDIIDNEEWSRLTADVGRLLAVHGLYMYTNAPGASRTVGCTYIYNSYIPLYIYMYTCTSLVIYINRALGRIT